jgi:putative membrane protein
VEVIAMMDWYDHGGSGWGGWLLMSLMMLLFWGAIVVAVVALWRSGRRDERTSGSPLPPDARQLLDERFARGEIDPDDYARRRELLDAGKT